MNNKSRQFVNGLWTKWGLEQNSYKLFCRHLNNRPLPIEQQWFAGCFSIKKNTVKFIKLCDLKSAISVVLIFHLYFCFQSSHQETTSIYLFCSDKNNICSDFKLKMLIWNIRQNTLQGNIDYLRTKNPKSRKHKEKVKYYKKSKHVKIRESSML